MKKKIDTLRKGIIPIYEPGLKEIVDNNVNASRLFFSTNIKQSIQKSNIIFITVDTPMKKNGDVNMQNIYNVAKNIGSYISKKSIIINKSTVPIGTAQKVFNIISNQLHKRKKNIFFSIVSNPEFLKEGDAIQDFMHPDRVIIGTEDKYSLNIMKKLYLPFTMKNHRLIFMGIKEAEMTKYVANAMLATKISFMNEISTICDALNIDTNAIRNGIGADTRIGHSFIYPGIGYGGSCFPKDVKALIHAAKNAGLKPNILTAVENRNEKQKNYIIEKLNKKFNNNLKGKIFTIWGLAFKPGTDDMRNAPSINIINKLIKSGAKVHAFDPIANKEAQKQFPKNWIINKNLLFFENHYKALQNSNAMILATEWKMFRNLNIKKMKNNMKEFIIFDGRNQYDPIFLTKNGFQYKGVGR
tara:strand:- start:148 stop:1386 length:1239 start_codon:yes stop_codon:yes gene_type:complete